MSKGHGRVLRILIADDHAILRKGLKQILSDMPDTITIDEAKNGTEVLALVSEKTYDIILLDISMPGRSGLEVLKQIKLDNPKQRVLILSVHPEEQYAIRALKAGASGYLTKASTPDELINAINSILKWKVYVSSSITDKLVFDLNVPEGKAPHETLSNREYEVFCLIASGKSLRDISEDLSLSIKTISTYRARLLEKLKLENNMQLTRYAMENHLI